jgi:hypothetical protein
MYISREFNSQIYMILEMIKMTIILWNDFVIDFFYDLN